jgi:cysteine synthase
MKYAETVLDLIGNTPLVRLNRVTDGIAATVLAKLEYLNPGGSAKDRIATRIIEDNGGRLELESKTNDGAAFIITLPLGKDESWATS